MKFIDDEHEQFYNKKLMILQAHCKTDVYYRAITYTLSICETTREHFDNIFNIRTGEINIDSLQEPYQTGTSMKVTRLAFNLWNSCNYDSREDCENDKVSTYYSISDIFCCSYAPYFYEAIKIRYPEYTATNETLQNTISDVITLVRNKYSDTINILLCEDTLTLEYMYMSGENRECFRTITVKEFEGKLSINSPALDNGKVIDIQELEDIFEILHRKSTYAGQHYTSAEISYLKEKYVKGTKIKLKKMYSLYPVPPDTIGTVRLVDDIGIIQMNWENGSTLGLSAIINDFEILNER